MQESGNYQGSRTWAVDKRGGAILGSLFSFTSAQQGCLARHNLRACSISVHPLSKCTQQTEIMVLIRF